MEVRGQLEGWFSPPTVWILGIELRMQGLAVSSLSYVMEVHSIESESTNDVPPHHDHQYPVCSSRDEVEGASRSLTCWANDREQA